MSAQAPLLQVSELAAAFPGAQRVRPAHGLDARRSTASRSMCGRARRSASSASPAAASPRSARRSSASTSRARAHPVRGRRRSPACTAPQRRRGRARACNTSTRTPARARSALDDRPLARRAAGDPHGAEPGRARGADPGDPGRGRPAAGPSRSLSARAFRRPAAPRRPCAHPDAAAAAGHPRRADLRPRRVGAGDRAEAVPRAAARRSTSPTSSSRTTSPSCASCATASP